MERRNALKSMALAAGVGCLPREAAAETTRPAGAGIGGSARSHIETRDGTRLFFRDCGQGRPLVFLAPWALNSDWWEYQIADLSSRGVRCIAYDRRGHGRSDQPGHGYDFATLADDLGSLIERLELRDVTLVGHSMGGAEVVRYLARHPAGPVRRAVLVATITPFTLKTADNPEGVEASALEKGRTDLARDRPHQVATAAAAFFGAPKNPVSAEIMDWWTRMILDHCSLKVMLDLHRAFTETDFRPDLRAIGVPTLLIHGDRDTSTPLEFTSRRSARLIPRSELKVYEGAAHGLPITHMERLNGDVLAFSQSGAAGSPGR
jgi:non-heme chloroperoxidase